MFIPHMTFGVEMEILVASDAPMIKRRLRYSGDDSMCLRAEQDIGLKPSRHLKADVETKVVRALRAELGAFRVVRDADLHPEDVSDGLVGPRRPVKPFSTARAMKTLGLGPELNPDYSIWRVGPDSSVRPEDFLFKHLKNPLVDIEVASAVTKISVTRHGFGWANPDETWSEAIDGVCRRLRADFLTHVGSKCGLHVHVGLGGKPVPHLTIKRFVTLIWLLEDAIGGLFAPCRDENEHCRHITKGSRIAATRFRGKRQWHEGAELDQLDRLIPLRLQEAIGDSTMTTVRRMWEMSLPQLGHGLCENVTQRRSAVSIEGCYDDENKRKLRDENRLATPNTIELRYPNSTLDPHEIEMAVQVFVRLFQLSHCFDEQGGWLTARVETLLRRVVEARDPASREGKRRRKRPGTSSLEEPPEVPREAGVVELLQELGLGSWITVWDRARSRWTLMSDESHVAARPFWDIAELEAQGQIVKGHINVDMRKE